MGKFILVLIVVAFGWGAYKVWGHWNKSFHLDESAETPRISKVPAEPVVQPVPAKTVSEQNEPLPSYFIALSMCSDWLQLRGHGIVERGEELFDGVVVVSWDKAGLWLSRAGESVRVRFERYSEAVERVAKEMESSVAPVTAAALNPVAPQGLLNAEKNP